jgi:phosphoribosyl 1,2-cyclic phosphodiesterase
MNIRFWGTRGGVASPSLETQDLGGNTTCIELQMDEVSPLIVDMGTGVIEYAIQRGAERSEFHFLLTHFHWDHIIGFPFFHPIHRPGVVIHVHSPFETARVQRQLQGLFDGSYSPLRDISALAAEVHCHQIENGAELQGARVTFKRTTHSSECYAYRLETATQSLAVVTDHEAGLDGNEALIEFFRGVDVLVHDAQFTAERLATRQGFGHSSIEQAIDNGARAGVGRILLTHHHPSHGDAFLQLYLKKLLRRLEKEGRELPSVAYAFEGAPLQF